MGRKEKYNWEEIIAQVNETFQNAQISLAELSRLVGVPASTLSDGLKRHKVQLVDQYQDEGQTEIIGEVESDIPTSIEDVAARFQVDLDVYNATKFEITGKTRMVNGEEQQTWVAKAVFRLKSPELSLHPVVYECGIEPEQSQERVNGHTHLVIPDLHFGFEDVLGEPMLSYHDDSFLWAVTHLVEAAKPDRITLLGDLLDLPQFSQKFTIKAGQIRTVQGGLYAAAGFLGRLRLAAGSARIDLLEGNHDKRLRDLMHMTAATVSDLHLPGKIDYPVLSLPILLGLKDLGIEFHQGYPDNGFWDGSVYISHGSTVSGKSGGTVSLVVEDDFHSNVFGHIHRREYASRKFVDWDGKTREVFAYSPGCGCKIDGSVPGSTSQSNWQQGVGLLTYDKDGIVTVEDVPFINQTLRFRGEALK